MRGLEEEEEEEEEKEGRWRVMLRYFVGLPKGNPQECKMILMGTGKHDIIIHVVIQHVSLTVI